MKLNCDMGESFGPWQMGADAALMPLIDMANIACGMHASDPVTMRATIALAREHGVAVGAHPGYPDKVGFGRRAFPLAGEELADYLLYQIGALHGLCRAQCLCLNHIKPHGALYLAMMREPDTLETIIRAVAAFDAALPLVVQAGTAAANEQLREQAAPHGVTLCFEAFADRAYQDDGQLVPRRETGAVHTSATAIIDQARALIDRGEVLTRSGQRLTITADTLCLHGDNPLSPEVARALRA